MFIDCAPDTANVSSTRYITSYCKIALVVIKKLTQIVRKNNTFHAILQSQKCCHVRLVLQSYVLYEFGSLALERILRKQVASSFSCLLAALQKNIKQAQTMNKCCEDAFCQLTRFLRIFEIFFASNLHMVLRRSWYMEGARAHFQLKGCKISHLLKVFSRSR